MTATNAVRLSEADRGILLSSMSDASCAALMGRSAAWVARQRQSLAPSPEPRAPSRSVPCVVSVKPCVRRWAGYFLQAGWSLAETARLFDLTPSELRSGLQT